MAFKQFTKCEKPGNFIDLSGTAIGWRNIFILLASGLFVSWFLIVIVNATATVAAIVFFVLAVAYLHWWLNGRLICLGGEQCLIGVITSLGPADPIQKGGDNDFSMYLLLPPGPTKLTEPKTVYWNTQPQGKLVAEHPSVLAIGRGYVQGGDDHQAYVTSLHCEFEGDGIDTLYTWAKVILGLLIAILLVPPVIKAILALLALFLTLVNVLDVLTSPPGLSGSGDPRDIDPSLGHLARGDIVITKGEWIYDSLHHGWNEIHPVRDCQVIGRMELGSFEDPATPAAPWPPDLGGIGLDTTAKVEMSLQRWCAKLDESRDTEDGGSRTDPQNDWVIHPLIDGCRPAPIIT
jgi:hypothetical protein